MRNRMKWIWCSLVILLIAGAITMGIVAAEPEKEPATLSVKTFSLSLENAVYMNFKVQSTNVSDSSQIKLLTWETAPAVYEKGTENLCLSSKGTEAGSGYELFQYDNLAAKDMTKMVYACAYLNEGGVETYSAPVKLSVAMYADMQKNDAELKPLMDSMLAYGAQAQLYFEYNTEFLATDALGRVSVVGGTLADGFKTGWYRAGSTVTMTAQTEQDGVPFSHWENAAGESVSEELTCEVEVTEGHTTYTAVYEEVPMFLFAPRGNGTYCIKANPQAVLPSEVEIPSVYNGVAVTQIESNGFENQVTITSIHIPDSVNSIGVGAFRSCSNLTSITVPNSVTGIGIGAFENCSSLKSITLPFVGNSMDNATNGHFGYVFGADNYSKNSQYIPQSLESVVITGGTSISRYAFHGQNLNIKSIELPDSITSIGSYAFQYSKISSFKVPSQLKSVESDAFSWCQLLEKVYISDLEAWLEIDFKGTAAHPLNYSAAGKANALYLNDVPVTDLIIPKDVEQIKAYTFYNCRGLVSVKIPDSVTSIGNSAFEFCLNLTDINIPNGVTSIGTRAFNYCQSLNTVSLPDSVTNIGASAFKNTAFYDNKSNWENGVLYIDNHLIEVTALLSESFEIPDGIKTIATSAFGNFVTDFTILTDIIIPNSVENIGYNSFDMCSSLTTVYYTGTADQWAEITISETGNDSLTSATVYYYTEDEPTVAGNWWHYVDGVPTIWETVAA